jgi:hypothetical protein
VTRVRVAAAAVSAALIAIAQFVPVTEDNPPVRGDLQAPAAVKTIVRRACYDCHSNETAWPWYGRVAPVPWLVSRHVNEARRRLNFSDWSDYAYDPETEVHKLRAISRLAGLGRMPPWYHQLTNPREHLTSAERETLMAWAKAQPESTANPSR